MWINSSPRPITVALSAAAGALRAVLADHAERMPEYERSELRSTLVTLDRMVADA